MFLKHETLQAHAWITTLNNTTKKTKLCFGLLTCEPPAHWRLRNGLRWFIAHPPWLVNTRPQDFRAASVTRCPHRASATPKHRFMVTANHDQSLQSIIHSAGIDFLSSLVSSSIPPGSPLVVRSNTCASFSDAKEHPAFRHSKRLPPLSV